MTQLWALRSRLEKQPTDLRRRHHYMRDGTLVSNLKGPVTDCTLPGKTFIWLPFAGGISAFALILPKPMETGHGVTDATPRRSIEKLAATSVLYEGTTVTMRIPLRKLFQAGLESPEAVSPDLHKWAPY